MRHNPHLIQMAKEPGVRISVQDGLKHGFKTDDRVIVKINEAFISARIELDDTLPTKRLCFRLGFMRSPSMN